MRGTLCYNFEQRALWAQGSGGCCILSNVRRLNLAGPEKHTSGVPLGQVESSALKGLTGALLMFPLLLL